MRLLSLPKTTKLRSGVAALAAGTVIILSQPLIPTVQAQTPLQITVEDMAEEITPEDEDFLVSDTPKIDFPAEVKAVRYITFEDNSSNLNDDVEEYLRESHPEWIQSDSFAPGEVIIAVGFDPRAMGAYAGNDVAAATGLAEQDRIDGITDSMRPLLQDGRIALAMLEGATSVADTSVVAEPSKGMSNCSSCC